MVVHFEKDALWMVDKSFPGSTISYLLEDVVHQSLEILTVETVHNVYLKLQL